MSSNKLQTKLIDYLSQFGDNVRLVEYNGRNYQTSEKLVAMGVKACHLCGCLMPLEKESCDDCNEKVFVMYGKHVEDEPKISRPVKETKICSMCKARKPLSTFLDAKYQVRGKCDECRFKYAPYSKKVKKGVLVV
jgi:hypothetical protein